MTSEDSKIRSTPLVSVAMTEAGTKQTRAKSVIVEKVSRRAVTPPQETTTQGAVLQFADHSLLDQGPAVTAIAVADMMYPLCDAAVRKTEGSEWKLADAILAECSEPGENGVRNGSQEKMEAMRDEIAKNHGVERSVVRIRKLRTAAWTFPADRRRPGVSLEGHLTAKTPEALDALIIGAPKGTALTLAFIRQQLKHPTEKADQDQQKAERRLHEADTQKALQGLCRQLERENEQLKREKEEREQRYKDICRTTSNEPEPFSPPLSPEAEPTLTVAEDLEQGLRGLLLSRGFDPIVLKQAMADFVKSALAQQQ